jgi:hypothetical protein
MLKNCPSTPIEQRPSPLYIGEDLAQGAGGPELVGNLPLTPAALLTLRVRLGHDHSVIF